VTNDEIETRITRLETQLTATQVLLHSVLPATVPAARNQILRQFGKWCRATEAQLDASGAPVGTVNWQIDMLANMYSTLEGALQMIEEHEQKKPKAT
jgi:hypothetical protein